MKTPICLYLEGTVKNDRFVLAKAKLDLTEPADSYKRYFSFFKGDKKARCRLCTKQISRDQASTNVHCSLVKMQRSKCFCFITLMINVL